MDENTGSMTPAEELKHMRELYGMKRSEFCEHFGIPLRSLQHWEIGDRKPAPFLIFPFARCTTSNRRINTCKSASTHSTVKTMS